MRFALPFAVSVSLSKTNAASPQRCLVRPGAGRFEVLRDLRELFGEGVQDSVVLLQSGKYDPECGFGIASSMVPALLSHSRAR